MEEKCKCKNNGRVELFVTQYVWQRETKVMG